MSTVAHLRERLVRRRASPISIWPPVVRIALVVLATTKGLAFSLA